MSGVVHLFTLHAGVRPFGCSVMFGTYDMHSGAQLHLVEPSGVCWVSVCSQCGQSRLGQGCGGSSWWEQLTIKFS